MGWSIFTAVAINLLPCVSLQFYSYVHKTEQRKFETLIETAAARISTVFLEVSTLLREHHLLSYNLTSAESDDVFQTECFSTVAVKTKELSENAFKALAVFNGLDPLILQRRLSLSTSLSRAQHLENFQRSFFLILRLLLNLVEALSNPQTWFFFDGCVGEISDLLLHCSQSVEQISFSRSHDGNSSLDAEIENLLSSKCKFVNTKTALNLLLNGNVVKENNFSSTWFAVQLTEVVKECSRCPCFFQEFLHGEKLRLFYLSLRVFGLIWKSLQF
jgi:hypothetical protein